MGSCVARAAAEIYSHKNLIVTQFTQGRRAQCTSQKAAEGESNHAGIDKWLNATIIDSACAHARALQFWNRTNDCGNYNATSHHECATQPRRQVHDQRAFHKLGVKK